MNFSVLNGIHTIHLIQKANKVSIPIGKVLNLTLIDWIVPSELKIGQVLLWLKIDQEANQRNMLLLSSL